MKNKTYIVEIIIGSCAEDSFYSPKFVTDNKNYAYNYVEKYNKLLDKINDYIRPALQENRVIKEEYIDTKYYRWWEVWSDIMFAKVEEIDKR